MISAATEHKKEEQAAAALTRRLHKPMSSKSDKRAADSALAVRALIVGPTSRPAAPRISGVTAKPQMSKIKSQLLDPKSANKIITKLREMPASDEDDATDSASTSTEKRPSGPIHAVCLSRPDSEMDELHFSKLRSAAESASAESLQTAPPLTAPDSALSSMDRLGEMFNDLQIVDLIMVPDLGLGQPGDGDGVLAGAVPTAETIINGIKQLTPQLMALGFATGKAILPDHTGMYLVHFLNLSISHVSVGIYPPKDRISIFTCKERVVTSF
jgi:hypothetical protein